MLTQLQHWVRRWQLVHQLRDAERRRSLEQVAADLRRLRLMIADDEHDSAVHQFGHRLAYDQLLVEACALVQLPHGLTEGVSGPDRELERLRTEGMLEAAGVVLRPNPGRVRG